MPSALPSPSGRIRSRTSDISDFLRGRHDAKVSMDTPSRQAPPSQIPAIPRLSPSTAELGPVTPPKSKPKFSFLARKRKQSVSPSSAKSDASAASVASLAAAAAQAASPVPLHANASSTVIGARRELDRKQVPPVPVAAPHDREGGNQPMGAGPSSRPQQGGAQQRVLPQGPPSGIPTPQSATSSSRSNGGPTAFNTHFSPYGPTPNLVNNFRSRQKASLESTRRSSDSRASPRPIITVSPPFTNIHEGEHSYTAPRSAPLPSGQSSPERPPTSLPTPTASERTTTPESPTSVDVPSPSTSTHSVVHLSQLVDGHLPSATSYKEETLLRKNHFDVSPDAQPRRGTVSSANNQPPSATVGFPPNRMERRHISVLQLSRLKREIASNAPQVRKMASDSCALNGTRNISPALSRSNTITVSPPQSPDSNQSSPHPRPRAQTQSPPAQHGSGAGKRMPPPLKRTWHTPPTTGPPREPLPSPPVSATLTIPTPTTSDLPRNGPPSPSSPRSRLTLPPIVPPKDVHPPSVARAQGKMSPDSADSVNLSVPSSPVRSSADTDADRDSSVPASPRTPVREDLSRKVLADENATVQELRDALQQQVDKYKRLSSYLLSLTERHALERAELVAKVELLERDRERREHEMKGLKWLVAHSGGEEPARKDSDVMPPSRSGSSGAARDRSGSAATSRTGASVVVSSPRMDGRMSMESAVGSVEEGLAELQSTISQFIAPEKQPVRASASVMQGLVAARRRARSNTVPNGAPVAAGMQAATPAAKLAQSSKAARRTSSPVIPSSGSPAGFAQRRPQDIAASGSRTGLGLGVGLEGASSSSPALSRSPSPDSRVDLHARSDSSTLSSLPSLSTIHSSSPSSGLSSIPETPRTDVAVLEDDPHAHLQASGKDEFNSNPHRLSTSSTSSFSSGTGSGVSAGSSRVSASPSIGQVLDKTKPKSSIPARSHHQPEMEAILRRLRAFGQSHSP